MVREILEADPFVEISNVDGLLVARSIQSNEVCSVFGVNSVPPAVSQDELEVFGREVALPLPVNGGEQIFGRAVLRLHHSADAVSHEVVALFQV